jgi:hypothetical protein
VPKQLVLAREPVDLSIVAFNVDDGEELFLTFTSERREGPDIRRTGMGPPYMALIGGQPGQITTNAFGLRLGTWLIAERLRQDEIEDAKKELQNARALGYQEEIETLEQNIRVLEQTVTDLERSDDSRVQAHDTVFLREYSSYEVVAQQGCGDLTMNSWKVAYVNNRLTSDVPTLVCLPEEPLGSRTYTCLIKWKEMDGRPSSLSLEQVRFNRTSNIRDLNEIVWIRDGSEWHPRADIIEFAVSGPQVIRDGKIVPVVTICNQFGDLRHLIHMPNLNPERKPVYQGELPKVSIPSPADPDKNVPVYRPRQYFNRPQFQDVWLGEEAFLRDATQNLLRTALSYPIFLDFPPDVNKEILRGALKNEGYQEVAQDQDPLRPGTWRFVDRGPQMTVLEVFFRRTTYAWSMIALSQDSRRILLMACTGKPGEAGYTVEEAAREMLTRGGHNALLIDEGNDVFQMVDSGRNIVEMIPQRRRRLRATFIVARLKK